MRAEIEALAQDIRKSLQLLRRHLDWDEGLRRLDELNALSENPELWNDAAKAQTLMRERTQLEGAIQGTRGTERELAELLDLIELADGEGDGAVAADAEAQLTALRDRAGKMELETLLSGEADANDCYLEVNSGAGGTESQDWAEMLERMYIRWAEQHGYKVELLEESAGEGAGVKSATIRVVGHNAYGWLKTESGVHRLVRISPFDSQARRHTSFSSVWVYPVVDDAIDIQVNEGDCRIDTYRASGAGGQHINKTDSAVRITHLPSGIVVECHDDRSQHKNKAQAMKVLAARIKDVQTREIQAKEAATRKSLIGSGDRSERIRTYNFPQGRMTDHRINLTLYKLDFIMDGDLDELTNALAAEHQAELLAALADGS